MSLPIHVAPILVRTIETFPFRPVFVESVHSVLGQHGIRIELTEDRCVLHFPEGTTKVELIPRVRETRYEVRLPDGYFLYETLSSQEGLPSVVRLNSDDFPLAVQEQLVRERQAILGMPVLSSKEHHP